MSDDSPLRMCGWMQFKHQNSGERVSAPAIATFTTRPVAWGEKERMALHLRSPIADASGPWEEVRHAMWAQGLVDEGKLWIPMGFKPNDPSSAEAIAQRISDVLAQTPREAAKNKAPARRLAACRFDEWFKGYSVDLVWDPMRDLEPTAKTLLGMASEGLIHGDDEEMTRHWLDQPLSKMTEKKAYSSYGAKDSASSKTQPTVPPSDQSALSTSHAAPAAQAPAAQAPVVPVPVVQALAAPEPATPLPVAPEPVIPAPVAPEPVVPKTIAASSIVAEPSKAAPIQNAHKPPLASRGASAREEPEAPADMEKMAKAIFGGPELPSFSSIAKAHGHGQRWRQDSEAAPAAPGAPAVTARPASFQAKELALSFARYPRHDDDGSIDWSTALLAAGGFMDKAAFDAAKIHRRATRPGKGARVDSLYAAAVLHDMFKAQVPFTLDGATPSEKLVSAGPDGSMRLDYANFALAAMAKSTDPVAANIPALARAKFYRDKLSDLVSAAPKAPAADQPEAGWIQMSPGPARPDATMAHPAEGLVRWSKRDGSTMVAKLSAAADGEKLRKLCAHYASALSLCKPAHPDPQGYAPPGSAVIAPLEYQGKTRGGPQGAR